MPRYNTSLANKTITGTTTIATPDSGAFVQLTGTAPYTVTVPTPSAFPGSNLTFYNNATDTVTLSTPVGVFNGTGGSGVNTVSIFVGNVVSVTSDGADYIVISEDGSALVATTGVFSGNVDMAGGGATVTISPNSLVINPATAGSVNNINIGTVTRGSAAFTSLSANSAVTLTANTTSTSTSSGTLVVTGGVGVSGAVTAGSVSASTVTGTLQTAAQPNITSLGTLTGLTVTNTITGSVSGSAATVTTAAQPAITSVGTLTALTVTGILYPTTQIRKGVNTFVREYASGYSSTHTPTAPQEIGRLTFTGNSQNITIVGEVRAATGATVGVNRFILNLRSNLLPDKSFTFYEETINFGFLVNVRVFQDTASGLVVIGYSCPGTIQNIGWSLTIQERSNFNYFQQVNSLTSLDTAGLTEVAVTPTTRTNPGNFVVTGDLNMTGTGAVKVPAGITAQRPASPVNGMIRFNTTLGYLEEYRSSEWRPLSAIFAATGGTISTAGGFTYHIFTTSGTFQVLSGSTNADILVVAGGGGGGGRHGGGGGGGGYIQSTAVMLAGNYPVVVGAGGAGVEGNGVLGLSGSNSSFFSNTAIGGGGGGVYGDGGATSKNGLAGGSGGGGGYASSPGAGTSGQGFAGGSGGGNVTSGGGGGANGAGIVVSNSGGHGGPGKLWLDGFYYAGGGGGAAWNAGGGGNGGIGGGGGGNRADGGASGNGGIGGGSARNSGGNGSVVTSSGVIVKAGNGGATTGSGGGGGEQSGYLSYRGTGGNGGSGIVIIRYQV